MTVERQRQYLNQLLKPDGMSVERQRKTVARLRKLADKLVQKGDKRGMRLRKQLTALAKIIALTSKFKGSGNTQQGQSSRSQRLKALKTVIEKGKELQSKNARMRDSLSYVVGARVEVNLKALGRPPEQLEGLIEGAFKAGVLVKIYLGTKEQGTPRTGKLGHRYWVVFDDADEAKDLNLYQIRSEAPQKAAVPPGGSGPRGSDSQGDKSSMPRDFEVGQRIQA